MFGHLFIGFGCLKCKYWCIYGKKEEVEEIATKIEAHFKIPMKIGNTPEKRYAQYKKNRSRIVLKDLSY